MAGTSWSCTALTDDKAYSVDTIYRLIQRDPKKVKRMSALMFVEIGTSCALLDN